MICWFEAGVTDSFGPQLEGMECLGLIPGSACPHYDGEELRRPRYHELVAGGIPGGWAADDGVALHFEGWELREVVTALPGKAAYRVELRDGDVVEERVEARPVSSKGAAERAPSNGRDVVRGYLRLPLSPLPPSCPRISPPGYFDVWTLA